MIDYLFHEAEKNPGNSAEFQEGLDLLRSVTQVIKDGVDLRTKEKSKKEKKWEKLTEKAIKSEEKRGNIQADCYLLLDEASNSLEKHENKEAVKKCDRVIKQNDIAYDSQLTRAHNLRGIAYKRLDEYKKAISDYSEAIKLNPERSGYYYNRGLAREKIRNYKKAINDYNKAINLDPESADAYFQRGLSYQKLYECEKAIEDFSKVIELEEENKSAYINRGVAYSALNNYTKAIEDLTKAIELDPESVTAFINRGIAYYNLEEYETAIDDITKAIELEPEQPGYYKERGIYYIDIGEYELALEDFNKCITLNKEDSFSYLQRSELFIVMGNFKKALEDAKKARNLGDSKDNRAISLMLTVIAKRLLGEDIPEEDEYRKICSEDFSLNWNFGDLKSSIESTDVRKEDQKFIQETIDLVKQHAE